MNAFFPNIEGNLNVVTESSNYEHLLAIWLKTIPEYAPLEKYARNNLLVSCKRLFFSFSKLNKEEILGKITKFEHSEICQDTDIPTRVIKNIVDTFADVVYSNFNDFGKISNYPTSRKTANITPVFKKFK